MFRSISLFLIFCVGIISFSFGQSIQIVSKFDNKLTKYYKVDTCRVYENVYNGSQTVQYLRKVILFNKEGNISQEIEYGQSEYDGHTITKYDYNSDNNITRKQILRPERDPIVYDYLYEGRKWKSMVVTYPYLREFDIQTNDNGLVLGILVKSMVPQRDSITGEPTGKEIFGVMEEYEYKYNRNYKVVKEIYNYLGNPVHILTYQYTPNGYGPPISMNFFKADGKTPEITTTYTYDPTGFLIMEVTKDHVTGYTNTLEYEYAFAWDSPLKEQKPEQTKDQKFWIGNKK